MCFLKRHWQPFWLHYFFWGYLSNPEVPCKQQRLQQQSNLWVQISSVTFYWRLNWQSKNNIFSKTVPTAIFLFTAQYCISKRHCVFSKKALTAILTPLFFLRTVKPQECLVQNSVYSNSLVSWVRFPFSNILLMAQMAERKITLCQKQYQQQSWKWFLQVRIPLYIIYTNSIQKRYCVFSKGTYSNFISLSSLGQCPLYLDKSADSNICFHARKTIWHFDGTNSIFFQ